MARIAGPGTQANCLSVLVVVSISLLLCCAACGGCGVSRVGLVDRFDSDRTVDVVIGQMRAQASGKSNQAPSHLGRDGLAFVLVVAHIALRAADALSQGGLRQSKTGSDGFNGAHSPIVALLIVNINSGTFLHFIASNLDWPA